MENINPEDFKLMYDRVYDELNRGRDWPIKVMTFASAGYLALFSILKFDKNHIEISCWIKSVITLFSIAFLALTIKIIITQHLNYLKYRDIQIKLQKIMKIYDWKIDGHTVFPPSWQKSIRISIWSGFYGWFFYASYLTLIAFITLILVWNY